MNRWTVNIGLGIVIYLSSSTLDSPQSFASSLRFSDRYELSELSDSPLLSDELFLAPNSSTQSKVSESSNYNASSEPKTAGSDNFSEVEGSSTLEDRNPFEFSYTQQASASSVTEDLKALFSAPTFNVQIESSDSETEETNLWGSIAESLGNLQFTNANNNSFITPNVTILPRVSYEDIYSGLYDFEINLAAVATITPRVANSSIPDSALITQESVSNYNPTFFASQALRNAPEDYLNPEGDTDNSSSLINNNDRLSSPTTADYNENLSSRIQSVLVNNVNVDTGIEEMESQSPYKVPNPLQKLENEQDPEQQKLKEQIEKEQEKRDQERQRLLQKLQNQKEQRDRKQQQEAEKQAKQRENERRRQVTKQEQILRKQESLYNRN